MTHRHQLSDKNRKRRMHRTEYRRMLEKAFKEDQKQQQAANAPTTDAKAS